MDFDVGDVVVCVDDAAFICAARFRHTGATAPKRGKTMRVASLELAECGVCVNAIGSGFVAAAVRLRKLPKADDTFTAEMRALRPHREKLPA